MMSRDSRELMDSIEARERELVDSSSTLNERKEAESKAPKPNAFLETLL
jgi:hypothetical protein